MFSCRSCLAAELDGLVQAVLVAPGTRISFSYDLVD